jgi:queuine tRNA-ribosyltransferase
MAYPSELSVGAYDILVGDHGLGAVRHIETGETMHSSKDPREEARSLYVEQPAIINRTQTSTSPIVIWDIGLGAATNVMECISALEATPSTDAAVKIISFESDLDSMRLAIENPSLFPHIDHPAPKVLLDKGIWHNDTKPISWQLIQGDFLTTTGEATPPDIIWYDPFSYKVNSTPWTVGSLTTVLKATNEHPCELYTYTASTAIRAGMLVAGWYVGYGRATSFKQETTVAYSPSRYRQENRNTVAVHNENEFSSNRTEDSNEELKHDTKLNLLSTSWLARWRRSSARYPIGAGSHDYSSEIENHPQFRHTL